MTSTPKSGKHVQESESPLPSPLAGPGPGGHKPSFKSTKLARRARSFKDDFLGKISQMRSPVGGVVRANSPKGRTPKHDVADAEPYVPKGPIHELDMLGKQIQIALIHFRDVVSKNKLEMLPGNGTIVLDTVWAINLAVKSSVAPDSGSSVLSATNHMYQSVARLIKLCDDALIDGDKSAALTENNVQEVVELVEKAVQNLIKLAQEKILVHQTPYKSTPRTSYSTLSEKPVQRNSLPDIPLTPREREILEQTSHAPGMVRSSHSTESILRDSSPPPKPPLPDGGLFPICPSEPLGCVTPPPLPPKRRNNKPQQLIEECFNSDTSLLASSLERMSLRSRSPEDSGSQFSASAGSLDSVEEIKAIMDRNTDNDVVLDSDISDIIGTNGVYNCSWEDSNNSHNTSLFHQASDLLPLVIEKNRLSNADSGFMSASSRYSSYSKRSSQQSSISSQWNTQQQTSKQSAVMSEMVKSDSMLQNMHAENYVSSKSTVSQQKFSAKSTTVSSVSSNHSISSLAADEVDFRADDSVPPAIPLKTKKKQDRQPSPYDNVPDGNAGGELVVACQMHQSQLSSSSSLVVSSGGLDSKPPPLPPKTKKHIMAYMEMFGNCSQPSDQEFMRHSVHMVQSQWGASPTGLPTTQSCSFNHSYSSSHSSHSQIQTLSIPPHSSTDQRLPSPLRSPNSCTNSANSSPPALPPKQRPRTCPSLPSAHSTPTTPAIMPSEIKPVQSPVVKTLPDLLEHTTVNTVPSKSSETLKTEDEDSCDIDLMEQLDVEKYLVFKQQEEDGPDIRGGTIDALIIQATKATKNGVFTYQEAFLTTYRTFIAPYNLICKLIKRYNHFYYQSGLKPRSREAFALIVRVVSDLTTSDLDSNLQQELMVFVHHLISCGELTLAKALRVKLLERHEAKQMSVRYSNAMTSLTLSSRNSTLLDFKSEQIAEQMTLLDAELFMKIEIPEVLIWAQEQNEERSPNLTRFTEHFNKMSYWARTKILNAETKDIREKYFMKFIKIMKNLRKINNFNSYLALLSALDSAPIRRLEWQKHVQEGLKEYCALIDSSSSFRAYRQALAETVPPCIPYIGLVLQDLTFVHIGNSDYLPGGKINFSKRWQQFNIVENMKRFKKCTYQFKKNQRIISFFQNFDDFIDEDAMWQLSESIKPRGGKKTAQ